MTDDYTGTLSGRDLVGTVTVGDDFNGTGVLLSGDLGGALSVAGDFSADVDVTGSASADLTVGGSLVGDVTIGGSLSADVNVSADLEGTLDIGGSVTGDVAIGGDINLNGGIDIGGALYSTGRILVDGITAGTIDIAGYTRVYSFIHLLGGIETTGVLTINAGRGNNYAGGDIHVGVIPPYVCDDPCLPPDITYDGCIQILDNGSGGYGDLTGSLTVVGCHVDDTDLGLTIEGGDGAENVEIEQTECQYQVTWSDCP